MSEKKKSERYRGNGKHAWEDVTPNGDTKRLRVPGGWLYAVYDALYNEGKRVVEWKMTSTSFVPMPEVVKHKV